MVSNGYLLQKYYCVQIDGFLKLGQEGGSASQKCQPSLSWKPKRVHHQLFNHFSYTEQV